MKARNDHSIGKVGSSANGHVFCVKALLVNGYKSWAITYLNIFISMLTLIHNTTDWAQAMFGYAQIGDKPLTKLL